MVHIINFFKETVTNHDFSLRNGHEGNLYEYKGKMVCQFKGATATPIINWLFQNVEHSKNTYTIYSNPKVEIHIYQLIKLLEDIEECIGIEHDGLRWDTMAKINYYFPNNIRRTSESDVPLTEYLNILKEYKRVFEPLVWVDKTTKDYNTNGEWYYTIISEAI